MEQEQEPNPTEETKESKKRKEKKRKEKKRKEKKRKEKKRKKSKAKKRKEKTRSCDVTKGKANKRTLLMTSLHHFPNPTFPGLHNP